ncbi:Transposon Ty3-I Gag-Pol polyprotein [Senna tora]|uniref:Transposon Ty3-I Gag-Pol polyprotein n=1 Tax=Senna tora TaxID=362788 RepID=A0A834TYD8_9FABA|nr:Transposon Ty3-I Gag-Pol polyprotein [Senna tora]
MGYKAGDSNVAAVDDLMMERERLHQQLRGHLVRAQERMKRLTDKRRQEKEFSVGSWEVKGPLPTVTATLPEQPLAFVQQPTAIIDSRRVNPGGGVRQEVLVEWEGGDRIDATWEGGDRIDATWEDLVTLTKVFPELQLEDKLVFDGEGTDMITGGISRPNVEKEVSTEPSPAVMEPS